MSIDVQTTPYGRAAVADLAAAIDRAKHGDPLAPVTVATSGGYVGLSLRRLLASGGVEANRPVGLVGVTFTSLARLAEHIGGPVLARAGRRPRTGAVLQSAVRSALAGDPGVFAPVRDHPSTQRTIARLWHELRSVSPESMERLSRDDSVHGTDLVRLFAAVSARLSERYDEHDLLAAATDELASGAARTPEPVVLYLPEVLDAPHERFVRALGAVTRVAVLLGCTGEAAVDAPVLELGERLAATLPSPASSPAHRPEVQGELRADTSHSSVHRHAPTAATEVVSCPGADTEVLVALRLVAQRLDSGVPSDRIAVLHGGDDAMAQRLYEQCALRSIPCNGPSVRPLSHTLAGRALLGALALPDDDWRRDAVMAWMCSMPLRHQGQPVPATAWDLISRAAGITRGLAAWSTHLDRYATERERVDATDEVSEAAQRHRSREAARARTLDAMVTTLASELDGPSSWRAWATWSRHLLHHHLGGLAVEGVWPPDELQAADEIDAVLDQLAELDELEPHVDRTSFRRALDSELASPAPQTSRFGTGILVAPYRTAAGLDLDTVIVVGMADGRFPSRERDDSLLPDEARARAGDDVPRHTGRAVDERRAWLAALAGARRRVLIAPRGDVRNGRELRPARWWLDGLGQVLGSDRRLYARDVADLRAPHPGYTVVASHTAAVRSPGPAIDPTDHDLRLLLHHCEQGAGVGDHWLCGEHDRLARTLATRSTLRRPHYDRYRGRLAPVVAHADASGASGDPPGVESTAAADEMPTTLSPTALETYATCPRRYLLERRLRIEHQTPPEMVVRIHPFTRGRLVHRVLERFVAEQIDDDAVPEPDVAWNADQRRRLDEIFDDEAATAQELGLTGHPMMWTLDQRAIRRDLHRLLDEDDRFRRTHRSTPIAVELPFGLGGAEPVTMALPDGRTVGFRGYIDRVDRTADGGLVVRDYKNSSSRKRYEAMLGDDPLDRGRRSQPAVYGLAARSLLGGTRVDSGYWLTTEGADFAEFGIDVDRSWERFAEVTTTLTAAMAARHFPPNPGAEKPGKWSNCTYCDFDRLCGSNRELDWQAARADEALAAYVGIVDPSPDGAGTKDQADPTGTVDSADQPDTEARR